MQEIRGGTASSAAYRYFCNCINYFGAYLQFLLSSFVLIERNNKRLQNNRLFVSETSLDLRVRETECEL